MFRTAKPALQTGAMRARLFFPLRVSLSSLSGRAARESELFREWEVPRDVTGRGKESACYRMPGSQERNMKKEYTFLNVFYIV